MTKDTMSLAQDLENFDNWIARQSNDAKNNFVGMVHAFRLAKFLDKEDEKTGKVKNQDNLLRAQTVTTPFNDITTLPDCKTICIIPHSNSTGYSAIIGGWSFPVPAESNAASLFPNLVANDSLNINDDGGNTYDILQLRENFVPSNTLSTSGVLGLLPTYEQTLLDTTVTIPAGAGYGPVDPPVSAAGYRYFILSVTGASGTSLDWQGVIIAYLQDSNVVNQDVGASSSGSAIAMYMDAPFTYETVVRIDNNSTTYSMTIPSVVIFYS